MGEIISNNVLLPIMYLLIDAAILFGLILLFMMLLDKILDSKIIKTIMRKIRWVKINKTK